MISQELLKHLLTYCESTGDFTWNVTRGGQAKVGSIAGSLDSKGYRQIKISGKLIFAHRLAWLYVYGEFPKLDLDHIDRNPLNNSISNLRECTHAENHQNINLRKTNTSGHCGVFQVRKSKKWIAFINVNKKRISLGTFQTIDEAIIARSEGKKKYHAFGAQHDVKFSE